MRLFYGFVCIVAVFMLVSGCKMDKGKNQPETAADPPANSATPQNREPFDDLASDYERPDRVIWQKPELVIQLLGDLKDKTVADIGAGTGYFAFRIAGSGAKVIAIDIDPRAIQWMENQLSNYPEAVRNRFTTRQASQFDPKLGPQEADIVLMVNTYIYINDRVNYFSNLKKGLKPGAKLVIIDFKKKSTPIGPDVADRLGINQVEDELRTAGYQIESLDDTTLDYQYIVLAKL